MLGWCSAAVAQDVPVTVADVLQQSDTYTVFARLVEACGLQERLSMIRDEEYEEAYMTGLVSNIPDLASEGSGTGVIPEHRLYGFTLFAETDATWQQLIGKASAAITVADVKNYLISKGVYPDATTDDNYGNESNIINQFVTYHILPQRLTTDKLVIHYNELGYSYLSSKNFTIAVEEFYTTLGRPRLLKAFESLESEGIFLNRFPVLHNGRGRFAPAMENINDYHESGTFKPIRGMALSEDENEGVRVTQRGTDVASTYSVNGIIYPITQLLVFTENVRTQLKFQRMRFDVTSILPEMANNDMRRPMQNFTFGHPRNRGFSPDYPYFENLQLEAGTRFYYLSGLNCGWHDYQGDEFLASGNYDFVLKLPPVPAQGHYELRFGGQSNSYSRGLAQVFVGTDPAALFYANTVDMRVGGTTTNYYGGSRVANGVGWEADTGIPTYDRFIDLRLHEKGLMKGANSYSNTPGSTSSLRQSEWVMRRVIWEGDVSPEKPIYLRIRNALEDLNLQFFLDYIEWCSKDVYANPEEPEDIW